MPTIYLIRHGQASFMQDDYDKLSPLGELQSRKLGEYFNNHGLSIDFSLVGTMERQQKTMAFFEDYTKSANSRIDALFNEHEGPEVFKNHFPKFLEKEKEFAVRLKEKGIRDPENRKDLVKAFYQMHLSWSEGLIPSKSHESWSKFKKRVTGEAIQKLEATAAQYENMVLFTSGGVIATIIGKILELKDDKIVDLNWQIKNTAFSTIKLSRDKWRLHDFNLTPHLSKKEITFV